MNLVEVGIKKRKMVCGRVEKVMVFFPHRLLAAHWSEKTP